MDKESKSPAWQRAEGKNDEGGLNAKGRASYNKATGGNLKAPVTESNPKGDRAKRQNSFCSRMCGMKKHETGSKTKKDPDSRINKSLRKWNCKCGSAVEFGAKLAAEITPPAATPAAPKPSLSSTSIGNSTNPPPGAWTGKVRLPINGGGQNVAAHAANFAAGNPVQPAQRDQAHRPVPQTILAPPTGKANNPITRMMDYFDPPSDMARAGRQVDQVADEFMQNSGELGRRFVADMATPGTFTPDPKNSGSFIKTQSALDFGAKLASCPVLADVAEPKDDSGVDVNPVAAGTPEAKEKLTKKPVPEKAEDVVNKAAAFGAKLAGSLVNFVERKPKDLTKGTLNPVSAGEEHEEVQEETTNEPASPSPMEFGAKAAFDLANLTGNVPPAPAPELPPSLFNSMPPQLSRYATENGPVIPGQPLPPTRPDQTLDIVPKAPGIFERAYQSYMDGSKQIGEYWGPKLDTASRALSSLAVSPEAFTGAPENAMGPAPKAEPAVAKSEPAKPEPIPNAPTEAGPKAEGSYLPYAVGGGLGAAGLAALVYYLMNQQKGKKRREEEELAV